VEVWAATKEENGHWTYTWTAGPADTFDVYLNGLLLEAVVGGTYTAELDGYDEAPPPIEVVADGDDAESLLHPPYALIQWRGASGASSYVVEQYVDSEWMAVKTIMDSEAGYYTYRTLPITDCTSTQFRVSAQDENGNAGTPVAFTFYVVRNPAPPEVVLTLSGGDIVVSAS
jgi:hypothetical protein